MAGSGGLKVSRISIRHNQYKQTMILTLHCGPWLFAFSPGRIIFYHSLRWVLAQLLWKFQVWKCLHFPSRRQRVPGRHRPAGERGCGALGPCVLILAFFSSNLILLLTFVTSSKNQMKVNQAGFVIRNKINLQKLRLTEGYLRNSLAIADTIYMSYRCPNFSWEMDAGSRDEFWIIPHFAPMLQFNYYVLFSWKQ